MAWTQIVSDIPMNGWSLDREIRAVAVGDQAYLFGHKSTGGIDTIEVCAFNPRTYTWRELQPFADDMEPLAPERKETQIHFAVAAKEKVYLCVGAQEMKVFDTGTSQWSCVNTSGAVVFGRRGVHACEVDGHVYMFNVDPLDESHLWALDLSTLQWENVGPWDGHISIHIAKCLIPYENRLYVLLQEISGERWRKNYHIRHFDLVTRRWQDIAMCSSTPYDRHWWIVFFYGGKLYKLLDGIVRYKLPGFFNGSKAKEDVISYSFATNSWTEVRFNGVAPPTFLHMVCVVHDTAVFFSLYQNKAYVLDFLPSLRRLCFEAVYRQHLDASLLPPRMQKELTHYNHQSYNEQ